MTSFTLQPKPPELLRLLLVEDSTPDADLIVAMLEDELPWAHVTVATSIADALPLLESDVDIVVADLSLPDAQGLEALTAIRSARVDIPVVLWTGRDDRQFALSALSAGADDYLVKGAHNSRSVATAIIYAAQRRTAELDSRRYERLATNLLDAMESATCAVDALGVIVAVNRAWRDMASGSEGNPDAMGVGVNYFEVCRPADTPDAMDAVLTARGLQSVLSGDLERYQLDYPCHSPTEERWFSLRINPLPEIGGAVLTHLDVSTAKRGELELMHRTLHDPLTELPNRLLLNDRLEQALERSEREECGVAVAFLDVDSFKRVNDSFGHSAGDTLLRQIGGRLSLCMRSGDTLSRFAGDEFVVVWPGVDSEADAELLAQRLQATFAEPFPIEDHSVNVTASIGVASGAAPQTADALLLAADGAMYDAKTHGQGLIRSFTSAIGDTVAAKLRLELEVREGIAKEQFVVYYQPVIDLQRNLVSGVEALVRWQHPDGFRLPINFIPIAESSGLIVPLGTWVMEQACTQATRWAATGLDLEMAINLSARQVSHPDLIPTVERILAQSRLPADRLLVEVTESTVMEDADLAQIAMTSIVGLGATIAIDDFGTGYSSLLYLKRYPIRALKIDQFFVAGMGINDDDDAIVASIVSLARAVGAVCIAEGVETIEQHLALRALGCHYAQGFLFSEAVSAADLPARVRRCNEVLSLPAARPRRSATRTTLAVAPTVVARVAELHHAGGSLHTIAAVLNNENALHQRGVRWHSAEVAHIVANLYRDPRGSQVSTA